MKAIVHTEYGPPEVLRLQEVEKPTPKENEVLVKIHAASLNTADMASMSGPPLPFRFLFQTGYAKRKDPRLGTDIAGRIEAVGHNVTQFQTGDEVFGACKGGFAEYTSVPENKLALKPANISFEAAAAVPVAAITALQGLRDTGHIRSGQKILVNGASGGVGTFAVQIAKSYGANVTAVCSTRNLETARSIGADQVIDYTQEDFTKSGQSYDLILAVNGYHPIFDYRRALSRDGIYVMAGASFTHIFKALLQVIFVGSLISMTGKQKMRFMSIARINKKDLEYLKKMLESGQLVPIIDRRYPLSEVPDALRYLGGGHARGKVVITVERNDK